VKCSPVLDNPRAARYNPVQAGAPGHSGNGFCNNRPFSSVSEYQVASAQSTYSTLLKKKNTLLKKKIGVSEYQVASAQSTTLNNVANTAIQHKLSRYVDTSMSPVQNGIYGASTSNALMTVTNLASEFRPYYEEKSGTGGRYMLWYDYAVIKLNHVFESIDHIGLTQKRKKTRLSDCG